MEPSKLFAYASAAALSIAVVYLIGIARWPRWAYWVLSLTSFSGAVAIIELLHPWNSESPWPSAIKAGLVAIAGAAAGVGIRGGPEARVRPNKSLERTRAG